MNETDLYAIESAMDYLEAYRESLIEYQLANYMPPADIERLGPGAIYQHYRETTDPVLNKTIDRLARILANAVY